MNFLIQYQDKVLPLSQWGLTHLNRLSINQGSDTVTLTQNGLTPAFSPENQITIFHNNKRWFQGIITQIPGFASAKNQSRTYQVSGPWWYLKNLIYQQGWQQVLPIDQDNIQPTLVDTGRVILGQNAKGLPISNGTQIEHILNYAIKQGAPIAIGKIGVNANFPYDETRDITCAEAIIRLLRWNPDAVVHFDYASEGHPKINITRRSDMPTLPLPPHIINLNYTPRHDLLTPAVVIKYEKNHIYDGQSWTTTDIDAYPQNADGKAFKSLVLTVELDGSKTQLLSQSIKTKPIDIHNSNWWKHHLPALNSIPASNIKIHDPQRITDLPVELIEGGIAKWMDKKVEEDVIHAKISYETPSERIVDREVAIKIHATNATTNTYSHSLTTLQAEKTPSGLAKQLFDSLKDLQFEGQITFLGLAPNFLGSLIKLDDNALAVVQKVHENIKTNQTTIHFGPPKHLGLPDLVELLRVNRRRRATRNSSQRISPKRSSNTIHQPTHSRLESTSSGSGSYTKMVLHHPDSSNRQLVLDPSQLKLDTKVELREEDVCENGILKKRLVLASNTYTSTNSL